jgi:hypothetical protein
MAKQPRKFAVDRVKLLQLTWTPLRFFVLVLLIIEATFIYIGYPPGQDKLFLFGLNVIAIAAVAVMVGVLAYLRVFDAPAPKFVMPSYKIFIDPSKRVPVDMSRIIWDDRKCFMQIGKNERALFTPAYPHDAKGSSLEVIISSMEGVDEHAVIRLELEDNFGNMWDVLPFRLWQTRLELRPRSNLQKIISDYSDSGDSQ